MKDWSCLGSFAVVGLWVGLSTVAAWADDAAKPEAAAKAPSNCRCRGDLGPDGERIKQVLAEQLKSAGLDFTEEPLENVVNFLQDEYQIPIQIDESSLEDSGQTRDEPLTVHVKNISLRSALRLLLKTKNLTYIIRDEVLIVTTPEEAEENLVTCVYDVRDLVTVPPQGSRTKGQRSASADYDSLINSILTCVQVDTWAENGGGEAEIRPLPPGLLIISQTQEVHEQIADLLSAIRETLRQPLQPPAREATGMMGGRGGYGGMGRESGYGIGGYGEEGHGHRGGEMGREPPPAEATPFD
ncbi:MAG: hypothetical protein WD971_04460 [Pirellulales bacterium]